ncbi:MAG: peptidoglycan bridge formation glycyltransferase FemA/FemB family protein [Patescibacteria group bacterium]
MQARILNQSEENIWSEFIANHPLTSIHQTPTWGHFQSKIPSRGKYWIVVLEENNKIIGGTMLIRMPIAKGYTWLYSARGPLLNYEKNAQEQMDILVKEISKIAKKEKAVFYRIDPPLPANSKLKLKGFSANHYGFQPEHTLILDLTKSHEEILAQMKPKGRYNIKLAEKKGVQIRIADPKNAAQFSQDIADYHRILLETTTRDKFHGHDSTFYKNMVETLTQANLGNLYIAEFEGKTIAAIIVTFFAKTAIYYYGVSSNEHRNVMAPYLLQWRAINDAKAKNHKEYDFLGIAPENVQNHPWAGVTDFKKKFGGESISYLPPRDHAFNKPLYLLYRIYKYLKK